jgi:hypothetical protein
MVKAGKKLNLLYWGFSVSNVEERVTLVFITMTYAIDSR